MQDNFRAIYGTLSMIMILKCEKVKRCLNPIGQFSITMAPFTTDHIYEACEQGI
jgi:hypothetical protein